MIKIGEYNQLRVTRSDADGIYLTNDYENEAILFKRELESIPEIGSEQNVFVYSDAEHKYIATLKKPIAKLNEFALLRVVAANNNGAFLDWGLNKDLFVPFAEQKVKMLSGRSYVVFIFKDEHTDRLLGSSRLNKFISNENITVSPKEEVNLIPFEKTELGVKVIINGKHQGLIFHNDIFQEVKIGIPLIGYIKNIREDEKIDVTLRKAGHHEVNESEFVILNYLKQHDGFMDMNDDSDPDEIKYKLNMSKKTFKKALGALYRQKIVELKPEGVYLLPEN